MNKDIDKLKSVKESFKHWRSTPLQKIVLHFNVSQAQIKEKLMPKDGIDIQFVEVKEQLPAFTLQSQ